MILTEKVKIYNINKIKYYSKLGYKLTENFIEINISELKIFSDEIIKAKCDYCDNIVDISYKKYNTNILRGNKFTCSKKCSLIKTKETNLERYGVENPFQNENLKEKIKITNLEKYGTSCPAQNNLIKEKTKKTNLEKYGVENPQQNKKIKEKTIATNLEKYGVENPQQNKKIKEKTIATNLEKYGFETPLKNKEVKEKSIKTNLKKYGTSVVSKNKIIKEKIKQTNLERYGVEYVFQNKDIQENIKITNLEKYGTETPQQNKKIKEKTKKTNLERYGVEYSTQNKSVKLKIKETNLERYGVEYGLQNKDIQKKIKITNLERYGVENPQQNIAIKEKTYETNLERYGHKHALQNKDILEKLKQTNIEKYGTEHVMKLDYIKEKIKQTNLEKYGVEYVFQNKDIQENIKITNLERYGVNYASELEEFKQKTKITNLIKYGVSYPTQNDSIKNKIKQSNLEKYGVINIQQSEEFRKINFTIANHPNYVKYLDNSCSLFKCDCDNEHEFQINIDNFHGRYSSTLPLCTVCYPIDDLKSIKEKQLLEFIKENYKGEILPGYRDNLEIDIYLPELNIGFEFNGLYWHSNEFKENNYHLDKTLYFKEKGIRIIHIFEDDWDNKREIICSQIKNLLGLTDNKIFARKCIVKETNNCREFLEINHIQGNVNSVVKLGLYYNEELVSVMTFDKFEGRKKMEENGWNLSRFCNKLNTNIIGGASKLLNYFIKTYNPIRIVSYADRVWSEGNLYYKLGFKLVNESKPDYKYIIDGVRKHKSNFKKSKLNTKLTESQEMSNKGINKIYDCGKLKFEIKIAA